jgi:orotate phosphoribosyltransferase
MKKNGRRKRRASDRDTMRPEYDFSQAVRGATAARYAQGANVVVIDPDILDVFPTGASVNEALRALAPVLRQNRLAVARRRSA